MTLLLKLTTLAGFLSLLVVGSTWLPPFPPQFEDWLVVFFTRMLYLDTWFPVRLAINLLTVIAGVEVATYLWSFAKWLKAFTLGESRT